jgi:hypothetical protein
VVDALGVNELNGFDQLHHEVADMLSLHRTLVVANGFVEIAIGAKFQNDVDVILALERLDQVDDMVMGAKVEMNTELFGAFIDSKGGRAIDSGGRLGNDLDGDVVTGYQVLGLEDHAKGAMVERGDGLVSSIEYNAFVKLVAHALHRDDLR